MKTYYFAPIPDYPRQNKIDWSKVVCAEVKTRKIADQLADMYANNLGAPYRPGSIDAAKGVVTLAQYGWHVHAMTLAEIRDYLSFTSAPCYKDESYTTAEFQSLRTTAPIPA